MTINDIITKYSNKLDKLAKGKDIPIYNGYTSEDIVQNCYITAMNKYGLKQISEEEGYNYLLKTILNELKFSYRRKEKDHLIFCDNIIAYDKESED